MSSHVEISAMTRMSRLVVALALFGVAIPVALAAGEWKQKLATGMASDDSRVRIDAVRSVEPDDKGGVSALLSVIAMKEANRVDACIRAIAIERLAAVTDAKQLDLLSKALASKDPLQREAASIALGAKRSVESVDVIGKLADDKDPGVRRAAIRALGKIGEKKGIEVLLKRWEKVDKEKQKDWREVVLLEEALTALTESSQGRSREAWVAFWEKSKEGWKRPSEMTEDEKKAATEERKKAEAEKKEEVTTTLREIPISFTAEGRGPIPLLVIHDDSWKPTYFAPYLAGLEDICRIYTIELPNITKLKIKKRNIGGYPYWPYDELCDAFDEIRKQYKHEKFAIMAHGFSTMIAMRYLTKFPENVSHCILVGAFPGDDAYGDMLEKLGSKADGAMKDKELSHAVFSRFVTDEKTFTRFYQAKSDDELEALERKFFTIMFANPQDPEIAALWERAKRPAQTSLKVMKEEDCQSPPFDIMREKKGNTPMLVISGAKSIWFGTADGDRVAKNYPNSSHVVMQNSAMMPWFEENAAFTEAVRAFFAKHTPKAPKK